MSASALAALIAAGSAVATNFQSKKIAEDQVAQQNEYNTPKNQMSRLEDAGLNPGAFGIGTNGLGIGGNTSAIPNIPHLLDPAAQFANTFLQLNQGKLSGSQSLTEDALRDQRVRNAEAECQNLVANTAKLQVDASGQKIVNDYTSAQLSWVNREKQASLDLTYHQISQLKKGTEKLAYEISEILPVEKEKITSEIKLNYLNLDYVTAQTLDARASANLKREQANTEVVKQGQIESETMLTDEEIKKYAEIQDKLLQKYDAEISKMAEDTNLTKEQVYWYIFDEMAKFNSEFMGTPVGYQTGKNRTRMKKFLDNASERK